jgi:hypothetical protein|tara:strand:- start:622 stop:1050 length:429 start_codon:yes stop_codon:yes gene_type:complete
MAYFKQGQFEPKNPRKYVGQRVPIYRSSWEAAFMQFCDTNPNIVAWSSEPVKIPYRNPFTGKYTVYVPDFLIQYLTKNGKPRAEMIEVKPRAQTIQEAAKTTKDRATIALNRAKWKAAGEWCKRKGIMFRILNEDSIYKLKR